MRTLKSLFPVFLLAPFALVGQSCNATAAALQWDAQSKVVIALPQNATQPEQTAANELDRYLTQVTGGDFTVQTESAALPASTIYVGATQFATQTGIASPALASEQWRIKTQNGNLVLVGGGTRGTLYATYRFLEEVAGVYWWNPWEETVPTPGALAVPQLDKQGQPAFAYRDIYMLYGNDNGRFAIRSRLNRDGDSRVGAEYGGSRNYGPPYHAHTFYQILSPEKYFKDHPDWFVMASGSTKPAVHNSQLAMSNPEMRLEFLKLLREIIRKSHQDAAQRGLPAPDVFSVSQVDNQVSFVTPADTELLAQNGGVESAILLDFVNYLADNIKDEFPHIFIDTLAYYSGEKPPTTIRPRDNVVVRLTDTTSNLILPITHPRNRALHDKTVAWSKITKNLRLWDYAVTFGQNRSPMPTAHTYATDYRFLKTHGLEGIFTEHEFPILADMRDFKVWVQCKLLEDPQRDYNTLMRIFTDGFYGPAGPHVRRYIEALQDEAQRVGEAKGYEDVNWFPPLKPYNYLSVDFLIRADAIFDEAERAAGTDTTLQRRVRHARFSLDRYMVRFHSNLVQRWIGAGKTAQTLPLDRDKIAARYLQSWNEQIEIRLPESQRAAERTLAQNEITKLTMGSVYHDKVPARFQATAPEKITVYGPTDMHRELQMAKIVEDPDSEINQATRYEIPADELAKYKLPMPWGVYDTIAKKQISHSVIQPTQVPGPGYHWYRLNDVTLPSNAYTYFFWSWIIQLDLSLNYDEENPTQQFEVWANIKFEGPAFPHGKESDKNAISVERIVLVKK